MQWLKVAVAAALLGTLYLLRGVLLPLFLAFLLAYALDPVVDRLERWRVPRALGAAVVLFGLAALALAAAVVTVPYFAHEFAEVSARVPERLASLQERISPWLWERFRYRVPTSWGELYAAYGVQIRAALPEVARSAATALFGTVNAILVLLGFLIVPVFALYLLIDFDAIVRGIGRLVPRRHAPGVESLAALVHEKLSRYVRGQVLACLTLGALYAAGLALAGLRLGVAIGFLTGMLAFVPYIGFGLGLSVALAMAMLDWHGTSQLVSVLAVMGGVQALDAVVITPRVVGSSVGLRPIEVLITMMAAAALFGFLGVLLAMPLGALVKILATHAGAAYRRSRFYLEPPPVATEGAVEGKETLDEPVRRVGASR